MEQLFVLLHSIAPMSPALEAYLRTILRRREFKRDEFILKEGQISGHIYFLEAGLVRIFHMHHVEVTTWFLVENDIFISAKSFFRQVPSKENIVALEDCICWGISKEQLEEICRLYPEFKDHRIWILEEYYDRSLDRHEELQLRAAVERYALLAERRPDLLYRVPVALLPSYLGVGLSTFHDARNRYLRDRRKEK